MVNIAHRLFAPAPKRFQPLEALHEHCQALANTSSGDTHEIGSLLFHMILNYYQDVREQAQQSFFCALGAAIVGTVFFVYAAWQTMAEPGLDQAYISLIAGALIQVISGISFYLYFRTAKQFSSFHICLERTNRFLLANTLCQNLESPERKDAMREALIKTVADAPMLTLDILDQGV